MGYGWDHFPTTSSSPLALFEKQPSQLKSTAGRSSFIRAPALLSVLLCGGSGCTDGIAGARINEKGPGRRVYKQGACLLVVLLAVAASARADSGGNAALDAAFQTLNALELGQDLGAFGSIDRAVTQSHQDEHTRADLERRFLTVLQGSATDLAKDYACRQLAIVGSDASAPVLAGLLTNPRLSYMARYALEGIGGAAATASLREMLAKTEGRQKIGVVISLGRLADADAVPLVAASFDKGNNELREVILVALGRIGTAAAAEALESLAAGASDGLQNVLIDAQLDAAESLSRQGQFEAAAGVCQRLLSAESQRVRAAAFRGLIRAKPSESLIMIRDGLAAEEPWKRAVAADCAAALDTPKQIDSIAAAIADLPAAGKIAALVSLKGRSRPAIRTAALAALKHPDSEVCVAALDALIASATAEDVAGLADLASKTQDTRVRDAALDTLRLMRAAGTDAAMIEWMDNRADLQPFLVRCALARRCGEFVPAFLKAAEAANEATRREALEALAIMATEKDAEALVRLLCKASAGDEREAAGRAVWMSCLQIADPAERAAPLLVAMEKADAAAQCALLPALARVGGEKALAAVRSAMKSADPTVRDAGYRALANWPDATVADQLLDIAKTSDVESYRVWSLRAYARVVALPGDRPPQKTFEMLDDAMKLASRPEDKELILSRLAAVRVPDALARLLGYVDDAALRGAAVPAVFEVAKGLSQSHPEQARAALEKIAPLATDPALLQQIPKVLRDIESRKKGEKP